MSESAGELGVEQAAQPVGRELVHVLSPTFNALPSSIYGGSNEIQRKIVARHVLNLPD